MIKKANMKIDKFFKITGISLGVGSLIFVFYSFLRNLNWIFASKDFTFVLHYVFVLITITIISLFIYGFGEILSLLYKINEKL